LSHTGSTNISMKTFLTFCTFLVFAGMARAMSDEQLAELLVGTWQVSYQISQEGYGTVRTAYTNTLTSDGRCRYQCAVQYPDIPGQTVTSGLFEAYGTWYVRNGGFYTNIKQIIAETPMGKMVVPQESQPWFSPFTGQRVTFLNNDQLKFEGQNKITYRVR
jgi:hypothetical protein